VQPATQRTKGSCGRFLFCTRREGGESGGDVVVRVLECVGAHCEVWDGQRARVYRWRPATIVLECECGERPTLTSSKTACAGCGADHTHVIEEVLETRMDDDEGDLPWRFLRSYFSRPKPI
jgi:hypothetical protein